MISSPALLKTDATPKEKNHHQTLYSSLTASQSNVFCKNKPWRTTSKPDQDYSQTHAVDYVAEKHRAK